MKQPQRLATIRGACLAYAAQNRGTGRGGSTGDIGAVEDEIVIR
jgi:hypothetical protein